MPSRKVSVAAKCLMAVGASVLSTLAMASLKEKPPKDVTLNGLWQLDPYRSDDPNAVLDQARSEMQGKGGGNDSGGGRGGMRRGGGG